MFRKVSLALAAMLIMAGAAWADPIEGNWKTEDGDTVAISPCGASFCMTVKTGQYAGQAIGSMKGTGGNKYKGSLTRPSNGKTYSGSGTLSGSTLKVSGCVLGILCESQTWHKL
ncbi:DUF2147 domain-containing protein [Mesorhizobium sp. M7A.F.Ca.US.001.01.1.1]|uniref:DUF2147 domain-containing protein n=1 Tax=Mesorhizobium sp. WSM1293 TaxID=1040984 RepID=UPI000480CE2A|nr:DUF2147 domain-containing protein [Mesorhizobium sp. WSM1293]RVA57043.1 DUF2147 domain-containing protein [Mesorhizobium sp. M7A.F.Ca.US.001.01.1.1]